MLDVHTHIDAGHLTARGLCDLLLYHMVISDLYAAGCPSGARLPGSPSLPIRCHGGFATMLTGSPAPAVLPSVL